MNHEARLARKMTATPTMARFPQIGRQNVNFVRKQRPHRDVVRQSLPHIGKYVIDTPRDEFLDWRQQYFRYHESNRGVLRRKIESLPEVPKRWDMRTTHSIPHKDLRETVASPTTNPTISHADPRTAESSEIVSDKGSDLDKFSDPETILRMERQMTSQKFTTKQRNFSRNNPVNNMLHCNLSWSSSPHDDPRALSLERTHPAISRRQPSLDTDTGHHTENENEIAHKNHHLENFSTAVVENLTDPESRRRMNPARTSRRPGAGTSYPSEDLSHHPGYSNVINIKHPRSERRMARRHVDTCVVKHFHRVSFSTKNIGPSSKNSVGSRNMRLGEILKSNKAAPSPNGNGKFARRVLGMSTWPDESSAGPENRDGASTEDDGGDNEDEMWLNVVNTPLVDKRIYDRYANVKLLPIKK
ncbi:unnamed protein product [Lymnaea stagnalis]|uniref:Uncharacterized protein n=1 Tax=Lymnaea stagnalis TaxID=6523 RepID=A0AAV2I935_LYMST